VQKCVESRRGSDKHTQRICMQRIRVRVWRTWRGWGFGGSSIVLQSHHLWEGFFVMCSSQQYLLQGLLLHSCVIIVC
jgi:hypothetical protein